MIKPIKLLLVSFCCAVLANCTSTATQTTSVSPSPLVSATALAETAEAGGLLPAGTNASSAGADDLYYIEFRARSAESYGHTFAMFGKRNAQGEILTREVAGLHPASTSDIPYVLGHLIPVPSETGPSDGDLDPRYMTARYRINLNEAEYRDVVSYIRELQASSPVWHAVLYNCSAFVGDIAEHMGLKTPPSLLFPEDYINTLKEMNT